MIFIIPEYVQGKTFLPVTSARMPPSQTSEWQKCDKITDPTSAACSCPCNSELVTITQFYPGHLQCIDPSLNLQRHASSTPVASTTNNIDTSNNNFICPSNFNSVGSSSTTCSESPLQTYVPIASQATSALLVASDVNGDPHFLLRCNCFNKCLATAKCRHVLFVSGVSPKCELYEDICTIANSSHADGLAAQLYRKDLESSQLSSASCKSLGWALTDLKYPQRTCSSAGVCDKTKHGHLLPGGRCRRRCSGDLTLSEAKEFCSVLKARMCGLTEVMTMNLASKDARACGGDFNVMDDAPIWTTDKCVSSNYNLLKEEARCRSNVAATNPGEGNEISLGTFDSAFECVQECAHKYLSTGDFQGCRYIAYGGETSSCTDEEVQSDGGARSHCGHMTRIGRNSNAGFSGAAQCYPDSQTERLVGSSDGSNRELAVQCCSIDGTTGSRPGCMQAVTYQQALKQCEDNGLRLCTDAEVQNDKGAGQGCNHDNRHVWTSTTCVADEGSTCWMISPISIQSCLKNDPTEKYIFDTSPTHHLIKTYEVFAEGQTVVTLDKGSDQIRSTCRGIASTTKSTPKAYAMCCGDRWQNTIPLFIRDGEDMVSSNTNHIVGEQKAGKVSTRGLTGTWSSSQETRFKEVQWLENGWVENEKHLPMHGPFNNSVPENTLTLTALPAHTHLQLSTTFYDTKSRNLALADICSVTVAGETYAGSLKQAAFGKEVHVVDVGSISSPLQFSCREGEAAGTCYTFYQGCTTCNANDFNLDTYSPWGSSEAETFCMSWNSNAAAAASEVFSDAPCANDVRVRSYRTCSIDVVVPHNESSVAIKVGPLSMAGRSASDLWAIEKLQVLGRLIHSATDHMVDIESEYHELYEDSQQWAKAVYGKSCSDSSCPSESETFCAPTLPGFCDGSSFDCLSRAKSWCLRTEATETYTQCNGLSHVNGETTVKLCTPDENGQIQLVDALDSIFVKRYRSVLSSPSSIEITDTTTGTKETTSGLTNWDGLLNGRKAKITVSGSVTMTPSNPHTLEIPCASGEVVVRQGQSEGEENCALRDVCVIDVNENCHVKIWFRHRCAGASRDSSTWSAYVGPGETATSSTHCIVHVATDSADATSSTLTVNKPIKQDHTTAMGWAKQETDESVLRKYACDNGNDEVSGQCSTIRGPFTDQFAFVFANLPVHIGVRVTLRFFRGGYWWWNERGWVEIDNEQYVKSRMESKQFPRRGGLYSPHRGAYSNFKYDDIDFTIDHTSSSLEIKLITNIR
jgi:hypothetical protein